MAKTALPPIPMARRLKSTKTGMESYVHPVGLKKHEVANRIVGAVAVNMMGGFRWEDGTAQGLLQDQNVLKNISRIIGSWVPMCLR
jgi:hypothetical protein